VCHRAIGSSLMLRKARQCRQFDAFKQVNANICQPLCIARRMLTDQQIGQGRTRVPQGHRLWFDFAQGQTLQTVRRFKQVSAKITHLIHNAW
jgi:hypothetical protein